MKSGDKNQSTKFLLEAGCVSGGTTCPLKCLPWTGTYLFCEGTTICPLTYLLWTGTAQSPVFVRELQFVHWHVYLEQEQHNHIFCEGATLCPLTCLRWEMTETDMLEWRNAGHRYESKATISGWETTENRHSRITEIHLINDNPRVLLADEKQWAWNAGGKRQYIFNHWKVWRLNAYEMSLVTLHKIKIYKLQK